MKTVCVRFDSSTKLSGHIVCMDSEWALTAIEETQFWKDVDFETTDKKRLSPPLKAVISVDIADDQVQSVRAVSNPEKLRHLRPAAG